MNAIPILPTPQLVIARFESLDQEQTYRGGKRKTVHSVIKNLPFIIELSTTGKQYNFHDLGGFVEAKVLYDVSKSSDEEKQVDYVKLAPIDYTCKIIGTGESLQIEVKLSILSSQHEDSCFKLKFFINGTCLSICTDPIKVVSKVAQLKKTREAVRTGVKRSINDVLKETLARIEHAQQEHSKALASILDVVTVPHPALAVQGPSKRLKLNPTTPDNPFLDAIKPTIPLAHVTNGVKPEPVSPAEAFGEQLKNLISLYHSIPIPDRAEVVRNVVNTTSTAVTEQLAEMVDSLAMDGLHRGIGVNIETGSPFESIDQELAAIGNMGLADLGLADNFFLGDAAGDYSC